MKKIVGLGLVLVSTLPLALACSRDESKTPIGEPTTTQPAVADAAAGDEAPTTEAGSAGAEADTTQPAAAASAEDPAMAERKKAVEIAIAEQTIADDPRGQWATTAEASSSFGDAKDERSYSPWQATGAPNVERYSDDGNSWASKDADKGIEWIEVGFAKPVHAEALRIRQTNAPGAIIKVELVDAAGAKQTVFEGIDSTTYPANTISWFAPPFEKTANPIARARITLATNSIPGWNEIDAIQLVGE